MPSTSAGIVTGLTAAALVAVGILTHQASSTVPASLRAGAQSSQPAAVVSKAARDSRHPTALPADSGSGERVVYSVDDDRVWLVGDDEKVLRTFAVRPGSVDPEPGTYVVTSRSKQVTGSDGVPVEHVVRFASVDGVTIGFSAAVGAPATPLDPTDPSAGRTGGIRENREDGRAMWEFATIGRTVVVIR